MSTRLYRSRDDRILAGVAGGLAELWNADPSIVRLIWALLIVPTGGVALVVYIVLAIVVPEDDELDSWAPGGAPVTGTASPTDGPAATTAFGTAATFTQPAPTTSSPAEARAEARRARREARRARRGSADHGRTGGLLVGGLLVLIGGWFLVREYVPAFNADWFWPLALVATGAVVLVLAFRPSNDSEPPDGVGR
jgi:phage shock protein C